MSFQSFVEVTFLQHQDIIFFGDFSPAGHNQRTEEQKLHHSCGRCRQWNNRKTSLSFVGRFPWWRFGRVAGILCLPLLTWHKHVGSRGVSESAHAHLSGRKQFVLKCDWTAAACTWKWMLPFRLHISADGLITPRSAALEAVNYLHKRSFSAMAVLILCVFYCSSSVLFLWLNCTKMCLFSFSFYWFKPLTDIIFILFVYTCLIYSHVTICWFANHALHTYVNCNLLFESSLSWCNYVNHSFDYLFFFLSSSVVFAVVYLWRKWSSFHWQFDHTLSSAGCIR